MCCGHYRLQFKNSYSEFNSKYYMITAKKTVNGGGL